MMRSDKKLTSPQTPLLKERGIVLSGSHFRGSWAKPRGGCRIDVGLTVRAMWQSLVFGFLLFFLVGCGEQVSGNKPVVGNTLDLQVQLGATPSTPYRYVLLYSKQTINVPADNLFFFLPGESRAGIDSLPTGLPTTLTSGNAIINYYYLTYFCTFSQAFQFLPAGVDFVKPTGTYFPTTVNAQLYPEQSLSSAISGTCAFSSASSLYSTGASIQVALDRINNKPVGGETIYGVFMTINPSGLILNQIGFSLSNVLGQTVNGSNIIGASPVNADIQSWKATIQ